MIEAPRGLEGVIVAETAISHVDGEAGRLIYRGIDVADLIERPFVEVAHLVLTGQATMPADFETRLLEAGRLAPTDGALLDRAAATGAHPMQVLQGLTPLLDTRGAGAFAEFGETAEGLVVAAKLPEVLAGLLRRRHGGESTPDDAGGYIPRFLAAIGCPRPELRHAFEVTQILQLEHSLNASTFTARVVASTLAPVVDALSAAFGALHGPLHGGADQAALETAERVGEPSAAAAFVDRCLAEKRKIMGMGHREYRVLDPRARTVKAFARELARGTEHERLFAVLEAIEARFHERMAERGKAVHANLEFYKGLVYRMAGLPDDAFTAAFALSRVFGYLAHFMESRGDNRIIRPAARYVGAMPEGATPVSARG